MNKIFYLICLLTLSGCGSLFLESISTLKLFLKDNNGGISNQVLKLKYASLKASINDRSALVLILAFDDNYRLTWVSADNVKIITQHGKIVETIGLNNDIKILNSPNVNSIFQFLKTNKIYHSEYYIQYSNPATKLLNVKSTFQVVGQREFIHSLTNQVNEVYLISEEVSIDKISFNYTNYYWITHEGFAVRSKQMVAPKIKLRLEVLKPYR